MKYIALIYKEADSDFSVRFPDFPGCVTAGATLEEAAEMAEDALKLHITGMLEDGEAIPDPTGLESILEDPENQDALAQIVVKAPVLRGKAVRVNITMEENLLARIDAEAGKGKRSAFIEHACRAVLERRDAAAHGAVEVPWMAAGARRDTVKSVWAPFVLVPLESADVSAADLSSYSSRIAESLRGEGISEEMKSALLKSKTASYSVTYPSHTVLWNRPKVAG